MDEFQKAVLEQLKALSDGQTTLTNKVDNLTGRVDNLTGRVDNLTDQVNTLTSDMTEVKNTLARVESEQSAAKERITDLRKQTMVQYNTLFDGIVDVRKKLTSKADRIKAV